MAGQDQFSRTTTMVLWVLQILAAAAFLWAGSGKLMGMAAMVDMYTAIGVGQWFRYVTGTIEVGSALMLLVPSLALLGAVLLACTMVGAIIAHVIVLHTNPGGPVVLLLIVSTVAWLRREKLTALLA